jgi:CheY-like chemotaxis protein
MQRTIVLVDGGSPARAEVDEILDEAGYETQIAASGRDALELMRELERPVVVVLDRHLPDMSTREFVAHLEDDRRLCASVLVMVGPDRLRADELVAALGYAFAESDRRATPSVSIERRRRSATALRRRARRAPPG